MTRARGLVGVGTVVALLGAALSVVGPAAGPVTAAPTRPDERSGAVTERSGFVGVPSGARVAGTAAATAVGAARAYVDRYAATLGVASDDLVLRGVTPTVAGTHAVRFGQQVDGVPVVGGEVVVGLRPGRVLGSAHATVATQARPAVPQVGEARASRTARIVAARSAGVPPARLTVARQGRWLLDPQVLGAPARLGTHTVWRFEVGDGVAIRRLVLVDVVTGGVVMDLDAIHYLDRVVCDQQSAVLDDGPDCVSGFARTETSGPSPVRDVNVAFDMSGVVAEFYDEIGGIDLTAALGIPVDGVPKLASTVRVCRTDHPCPFPNAFWNGRGMYYGAGFADADDVVGHEMTHGIIDQYSQLFYWGQSGAINESIADVMGQIVDARNVGPGDGPTEWLMGEDLAEGPARNVADPTWGDDPSRAHPDSMTSRWYAPDRDWHDSGGVHSNSGVGNKTAYLISQGGTFGGQEVRGIDEGDPTLTKTATLYLLVLQTLSSGSGYADLADVLDQSCQDLVGTVGFTPDDCEQVHRAGLATRLRTTPPRAPQPADAPATCPSGTTPRVLLDSEVEDPASAFRPGRTWSRGPNAATGVEAWFSRSPDRVATSSLQSRRAVRLPAGQRSYLWFQHWYLLDHHRKRQLFFDGGVVEVNGRNAARLPWVNGPRRVLSTKYRNPAGGQRAFSGDSLGYLASRVNLSSYAGRTVRPAFTMYTDEEVGFNGWYVDDVRVYTCDPRDRG